MSVETGIPHYDFKAGKRTKKATFKDGERFHIWLSRNFRTVITLRSGEKQIATYPIGVMDIVSYGDDPYLKPAPIIIALGKSSAAMAPTVSVAPVAGQPKISSLAGLPDLSADIARDFTKSIAARKKYQEENEQTMHIVEVTQTEGATVPQQIADFFKRGGEETAIDTTGIMTRNWLWAQIAGTAGYLHENKNWIKELWGQKFYLQKVKHKTVNKWYIVFKGYAGLRQYFTSPRYPVMNPKVLAITGGAGSASGVGNAAWNAAKGSLKRAGLLSIIFVVTLDTAEWLKDYEQRDPVTGKPKKDFFDLAFKIGVD